jgi:dihydrofolate reductase
MIGMIAAVTKNGIIGIENKLPFDYPADMKHFRTTTANSIVIMGRKTFEGIGRPLPKRRNIVVSRIANGLGTLPKEGIEVAASLDDAVALTAGDQRDVWFIGGAFVYEEGMEYADKIVLTLTPDVERRTPAVKFPWINPQKFELKRILPLNPEDPSPPLFVATYEKITS